MTTQVLAPIIIFAFNRVDTLKNTIESLKKSKEAKDSELFVFVDGPRSNKEGEKKQVRAVQEYVKTITGFKNIKYKFSETNKGLAPSVIGGTTQIFKLYNKIIVIEDDLILSQSFLQYMNQMLDLYEKDNRIMQISGWGCKLTKHKGYPYDAFLNKRARSWSWATWKDRWETVDWEVKDWNEFSNSLKEIYQFNRQGSDLYKMLRGYMTKKNCSWYIRFQYAMHKQNKYSVQPIRSLVINDGFGGNATNCKNYNRYKVDFEEVHKGEFNVPPYLEPCKRLQSEAIRYNSIRYRIYGLFMTQLMKFRKSFN